MGRTRRNQVLIASAVAAVATVTLAAVPTAVASATTEVDHAKVTTVTTKASAPYTPQAINGGTDDYHCTLIDPHVAKNSFIVSSQFFPGTGPSVKEVHHAILFLVPPALVAAARSADAGGHGWTCFGEPPVLGKGLGQFLSMPWLSAWAPGHGKDVMPLGTGTPLPAKSLIIMQVHYNLLAGDLPVSSHAQLDTVPAAANLRPTSIQPLVSTPEIPCPAGVTGPLCTRQAELADLSKRFGSYMTLFDAGMEAVCGHNPADPPQGNTTSCVWHISSPGYIVRVAPHMHLVGTSMKITLNPGTPKASVVMNVPKYDFNYQKAINLKTWVKVTPGESVKVTCTYDPRLAQELPALRKLPPHYIRGTEPRRRPSGRGCTGVGAPGDPGLRRQGVGADHGLIGAALRAARRGRVRPGTVWAMGTWGEGWTPATVGEAREYLDAHERDGDPAIVAACEAKIDVIEPHEGRGAPGRAEFVKPSLDQLEEEGAD